MEKDNNPYIKKAGGRIKITAAGHKYLDRVVTDSTGPVYAFSAKSSPLLTAAAMARLSRRGSDLRETYLDEFASSEDSQAAGLIHRVVTAYGDDSVQQLIGLHIVVEDASNLLTKKLEWGRFAAYLEQSTRYIYFDEKDNNGKYRYFVPHNLDSATTKQYVKTHDRIFDIYSDMVRGMTDYVRKINPEPTERREAIAWRGATKAQACDAIRPVLPVSTKSTVGIFGSAQAIESLILHLLADELDESRQTGKLMLEEARKVIPAFLERADKPERGGATTAFMANKRQVIADFAAKLPKEKPVKNTSVQLLDYWPKNELELVEHLLFADSAASTKFISKAVAKLSVTRKKEIIKSYTGKRLNRRHRPGRAFEIPHYLWEIMADYGTFRDLQRHRVVDAFEWQALSTQYGYEIPSLVIESGYKKEFEECFKLSEQLVEQMKKKGYAEESQYATLFGHRMRYKFMLNARAAYHFIELRSAPQGHPGYRKIANQMHELMKQVHPIITSSMSFVNKDEDPKLTRMAAELATQYKLEKLDS